MLGFPLGILSAAGAAVEAGAYELIETQVLGTAVSSITFSSLATYASTYKHLQIRTAVRSSRAETFDGMGLRLNGDTGSNYVAHFMVGDGSSVTSSTGGLENRILVGNPDASTATASAFGANIIDILDSYSTSKNTTIRALSGAAANRTRIFLHSGMFINTASVTSATLFSTTSNNFVIGSRFSLYGIKG
jgi:hypothetical protein